MGKDGGFLTPKAISNRMKSKGLQKLRWYCQMCEKQCRDENGFKCHTESESHQRQLLLVSENPNKFVGDFSQQFHEGYMCTLKRRFGTKRIQANVVYQEYIKDRDHVHMNSTSWMTLSGYVQWLGKEGHCIVDQTEKGWYVTWIDRDPETIRRQSEIEKKERMDLDDEQRRTKLIEQQIQRAKESEKHSTDDVQFTEFVRKDEDEKVQLTFTKIVTIEKPKFISPLTTIDPSITISKKRLHSEDITGEDDPKNKKEKISSETESSTITTLSEVSIGTAFSSFTKPIVPMPKSALVNRPKKSALEEIMAFEEKSKEQKNRKDYWLHERIIVKVITAKLGEKYQKKKAVVVRVENHYQAVIKMIDTNDKIRVDQSHVETVIPAVGKKLLIVNGAYRGCEAILEQLHQDKFCVDCKLLTGPMKGCLIEGIVYEDVSKLVE